MSRYKLVDCGYPTFKKIMSGRNWVGRVVVHAEGGYLGKIGDTFVRAPTERAAFEEVVSQHLGYSSATALRERNAEVAAANRVARQRSRALADRFMRGDLAEKIAVVDQLLGLK